MDQIPSREHGIRNPFEVLLEHHSARLEVIAAPNTPLTSRRLQDINHPYVDVFAEAEASEIGWPDENSSVTFPSGSKVENYYAVSPEKADELFVTKIIHERSEAPGQFRGYNNFPLILKAEPCRPSPEKSFMDLYRINPSDAVYGTKPYLWRAYILEPDFMLALHEQVTRVEKAGISDWREILLRGASSPESFPSDAALLRASRIAYLFLTNLMRTDDLKRQNIWTGMPTESARLITDPHAELWT